MVIKNMPARGLFFHLLAVTLGFQVAQWVNSPPPAIQETQADSSWSPVWENLQEDGMATHSRFLFEEPHEQRSLLNYSPQGHKELDMTEMMSIYAQLWSCKLCNCPVFHILTW